LLYGFTAGVHAIDAGVEVRRDETLSDRLQDRERLLTTWEPFAQYTWSAADGAVSVVPGLRMSSNEQWGTHWSPRFAVLWRASESLALRTSIGEGFRSPSFRELYLE